MKIYKRFVFTVLVGMFALSTVAPSQAGTDGTVIAEQEISNGVGGFGGALDLNDLFGYDVTSIGDLDGDGIPDLAVAALADDDGGTDRGALWILFMNADGTVKAEQKISDTAGGFMPALSPPRVNFDFFGNPEAIGDLDGDGVTDLAVGSQDDETGGFNHGAVYILFLNANGTVKSHQKIADGVGGFSAVALDGGDQFGASIANLGDLDGDGVTDLAVAATFDDDGSPNTGAVYVLFMNANGTVKSQQKISATSGGFGGTLDFNDVFSRVAGIGDLNGDSIPDLAVGARGDDDGGTISNSNRGAVWILFLDTNGTVKSQQKISSTQGSFGGPLSDGDRFGDSLINMGDIDGDGLTDIAVGATGDSGFKGAVWILFLNADGTAKSSQKISDTEGGFGGALAAGDRFGDGLGLAGDLNGDGLPELAVGATQPPIGFGSVWVIFFQTPAELTQELIDFTIGLDPGDFSNPNRQGALVNQLNAVLTKIQAGDLCGAIDQLTNSILPKTDGETPPPDWVTDPIVQQDIEDQVIATITALQSEADTQGGCP